MYHLRVPVFLLTAFVLLRCIATAPSDRYFRPGSSSDNEQENGLADKESRSLPELISDPFLSLRGARPQRQDYSWEKIPPKCNVGTCLVQRIADILHRHHESQKNPVPLDVGPGSFGKRDIHQPPAQLPF